MNSDLARQAVLAPATALIVVSGICLAVILLGVAFDIWLIVSGAAERMRQPDALGITKVQQLTVRIIWGALILVTNAMILIGAAGMLGV